MANLPSATVWGSPTSTKNALFIHGLTSSGHTWHHVASSLAAQGYFVVAPNLPGHGGRGSTDYHFDSIAKDLLPHLKARNFSLVVGHSVGACAVFSLFQYLSLSDPIAILLIDPPMQQSSEKLDRLKGSFTDSCINIKSAEAYRAENPLWTHKCGVFRELGIRMCSIGAVHGIFNQNRPWDFFHYLNAVPDKWKMTALLADPAVDKLCGVEDFLPYPHIRPVVVPGAGHWIQYDFPEIIVEEALKRVAELDVA